MRWAVSTGSCKGPWDHSKPLYLGGSLAIARKRRYCGGGSGYTLNRVALDMLITELWNDPECWPHWRAPDEDVTLSKCFRIKKLQCMDTNDELEETRWHAWDANYHAKWDKSQVSTFYSEKRNLVPVRHNIACSRNFIPNKPTESELVPKVLIGVSADSLQGFYGTNIEKQCIFSS